MQSSIRSVRPTNRFGSRNYTRCVKPISGSTGILSAFHRSVEDRTNNRRRVSTAHIAQCAEGRTSVIEGRDVSMRPLQIGLAGYAESLFALDFVDSSAAL